jgi:hypothetical protein
MSDDRVKRPHLERSGPVRNWARMLVGDALPDAPPAAGERRASPSGDAISRSVELGYRVVDEYIAQGRRAAERLGVRPLVPGGLGGDPQELGARMMRYASDFVTVWMQLMEAAVTGGALRAAPPAAPPPSGEVPPAPFPSPGSGAAPTAPDGTRVRIEVTSLWPTEVLVDLRPEASGASVVAHALRAVDPELPRIDGVSFASNGAGDPPLLRVRIPPSQPPGVYNGLLVDRETSRPVGTVSVRVSRE